MFIVLLIILVVLVCFILFILFLKGNYYETPAMSVQNKCFDMLKKLNEVEKVAMSLQREEVLQRFSCKRCIKQNDMLAAKSKAKKCIELRRQSQAYFSLCHRVRIFIKQVNLAIDRKDKTSKELLGLVNPIADGVKFMNVGLVELYLEAFEKKIGEEIKQQMKEVQVMSHMDAYKNVTMKEIDSFIHETELEAMEDMKAFMYETSLPGKSVHPGSH